MFAKKLASSNAGAEHCSINSTRQQSVQGLESSQCMCIPKLTKIRDSGTYMV